MLANGRQEKKIFDAAVKGHWGIGAFNVMGYETVEAVLRAAEELDVPVILQVGDSFDPNAPESSRMSEFEFRNFNTFILNRAAASPVPVIIHLDHCMSFEGCIRGIQNGCASVMLDASQKPFDENAALVKKVVEAGHGAGVLVEGEIGHVSGHPNSHGVIYTEVDDAVRFAEVTGLDLLAVSIGTVHGYYATEPVLNYKRIEEIRAAVDLPLVMHGASGLTPDQYRDAIKAGINKVNFATYTQIAGGKAIVEEVEKGGRQMFMRLVNAGLNGAKEYLKMHMQIFGTQKVEL